VDIDSENFSLSIEDLKKKIDSNTKVIVLQHTFGLPGPIDEVMQIAKANGIYVLEDCAHSLGNMSTGTRGDGALLSFGIEKVLPTRAGGALVVNNAKLAESIEKEYRSFRTMGFLETFVWLLNPFFWRFLRLLGPAKYTVAKWIRGLRMLNMGFENSELLGRKPSNYPKKLSNGLARFVYEELLNLDANLTNRKNSVKMYDKLLGGKYGDLPLVRYPYLLNSFWQVNELSSLLVKKGFVAGDWYRPVVYPASTNLASMKYVVGSCPVAEKVSKHIVNLPTGGNLSRAQAEVFANAISSVMSKE
jgi:dTDP-4-amino-4,6-dideoxygalactose transaminase